MWKWNQNNKIQSVVYPKHNLWFSTIKYLHIFLLSQNCVFKNPLPSSHNFPFWASQVTSSLFQKQQEFKIQTNNVPWSILIQMPCSSKPCTHPTPLTKMSSSSLLFMWMISSWRVMIETCLCKWRRSIVKSLKLN